MNRLIFILLLLCSSNSKAQYTQIPDSNFEDFLYWEGIDLTQGDGQVLTANIDTVLSLNLIGPINDLTGIGGFLSLENLSIISANIANLDLSNNQSLFIVYLQNCNIVNLNLGSLPNLKSFYCSGNPLTVSGLNLSNCTALENLTIGHTGLTSLDVSNHPVLERFWCNNNGNLSYLNVNNAVLLEDLACHNNALISVDFNNTPSLHTFSAFNNQLTVLDFSNNPNLYRINIHTNQLHCLNIKNGWTYFGELFVYNNPNLICVEVQDESTAAVSWTDQTVYKFDQGVELQEVCDNSCSAGIEEFGIANKTVVKVIDFMGRKTDDKPNTTLIYIYSDGTTEKVYRME